MNDIVLRPYQQSALDSWQAANYVSILEMATGTGKTFTAVIGTTRLSTALRQQNFSTLILIVCPYLHLVDQWTHNFKAVGLQTIEACESSTTWQPQLVKALAQNAIEKSSQLIVVATQSTFLGSKFQEVIKTTSSKIIFVADEVHNLGSRRALSSLPKSAEFRLGLSATPERAGDSQGTQGLQEYFGRISFRLSIKDAIDLKVLSPYFYFPRVVRLTDFETQEYAELTIQLARILKGMSIHELDPLSAKRAGAVLRQRAALIGDSKGKLPQLERDLTGNLRQAGQLVFCSEGLNGMSGSHSQIEKVQALISDRNLGRSAIYDSVVSKSDRQILLREFRDGRISHLLSMRCLDEGVDVPNARVAYLLASSTNPRQFVQRRGRVLRSAPNKESAYLYDYFVVPKMSSDLSRLESENKIVEKELARTMEFIDACENKAEALEEIEILRGIYGKGL